ncbi:MAG: hypothetical protein Q6J68_01135 [Thermostichales cyanobacterium SZTDM-1c_bins_54]
MGSRTHFWGLILAMLAVSSLFVAPQIPVPSRSQPSPWTEPSP